MLEGARGFSTAGREPYWGQSLTLQEGAVFFLVYVSLPCYFYGSVGSSNDLDDTAFGHLYHLAYCTARGVE